MSFHVPSANFSMKIFLMHFTSYFNTIPRLENLKINEGQALKAIDGDRRHRRPETVTNAFATDGLSGPTMGMSDQP